MKVCTYCFKDEELRSFISSISKEEGKCKCCSNNLNSSLIELSELLDFFEALIGIYQPSEKGTPLVEILESDWDLFASNKSATSILSKILSTIKSNLSDYKQPVIYEDKINNGVRYWDDLKKNIKWKKRFTTNIEKLEENLWDKIFSESNSGFSLQKNSKRLFRARLHKPNQTGEFSSEEMGPPQEKVSAGRANPSGIPFLYLSEDMETTLYEVRATLLDEISIGTFQIEEEIKLIDFTSMERPSVFDAFENSEIYLVKYGQLLKEQVGKDMSRPLRRYDSEIAYIPTQFICEYIRQISNVDGIIFSSSLDSNKGRNIVLFSTEKVKCISVEAKIITEITIKSENKEKQGSSI